MKYPIGIQTFEEIITGGYVYVDKTDLVYKLVSTGEYYFLSRPRCFGTSLLTTTLEAYFQGKKELFKGLAIEQLEKEWVEYPVFHLDFSGEVYTKTSVLVAYLDYYLNQWEKIYGKNKSEVSLSDRLYGVISRAKEQTGKHVVLLIDEYDKPLIDTIGHQEIQDANRNLLQGVFGVMKRADRFIRFAFMTGSIEYEVIGVYSGANNLDSISFTDYYSSICGITEEELHRYFDDEVQLFADKLKVSKDHMYQLLKQKYEGYHFSIFSDAVYNPYSLLNALSAKQLMDYWYATGSPKSLVKKLKENSFELSIFSNGFYTTETSIKRFGNGENNITAALYQSGYLTIKDYEDGVYMLGFPNEEVADGFTECLMTEFSGTDEMDSELIALRDAIEADDVDYFMKLIQFIIGHLPSEKEKEHKMIELNFRNLIYLIISSTFHKVFVEHPMCGGRIDIFFETNKCAYIIECNCDGSAQEALAQIDENKYAKKISSASKQVVKIGVKFCTKKQNITEWVIQNANSKSK